MLVPFEELSPQSRLWIYASKTRFTEDQKNSIKEELDTFTESWEAHGASLMASYRIEHEHFIVIAVDEGYHAASGCSIDKSVQVIRTIESRASIDLMDRMVAFIPKYDNIEVYTMNGLKPAIEAGLLTVENQVFDNSISSIEQYKNEWLKPVGATWLLRYFPSVFK
ncbi:MAG: hypothetical protein H7259_02610 [Cytophagales bacterium]|nr:hypothetical protein [Cytophaga sp.]